jgi:hypothetical protein
MGSLWSWRSSGSILSIASEGSILSIGSAGSILSLGSIGSVGSLLSIGSAASVASALSFASRRSLLSARASDSALGLPLGRRQRCAVAVGLVAAGAAFAGVETSGAAHATWRRNRGRSLLHARITDRRVD